MEVPFTHSIAILPNGKWVVSGSYDSSPAGGYFASGGSSGVVKIWRYAEGKMLLIRKLSF